MEAVKMKKVIPVAVALAVVSPLFTANSAYAETELTSHVSSYEKDQAIEKAMDKLLDEVNTKLNNGEESIVVQEYVEEIGENITLEFETKDLDSSEQLFNSSISKSSLSSKTQYSTLAALPSGRKSYKASVNGVSFTHTLLGEFVYSGGKVTSATKEVRTSGLTYSHDSTSKITKLDPSVWSVKSTSKHKWLGSVGNYTGFGYTSHITVELYGSGNSKIVRSMYTTGV